MNLRKLLLLSVLTAAFAAFFWSGLHRTLTLAEIKAHQAILVVLSEERPLLTAVVYGVTYASVTALSLPLAGVMTLLGGAVFGLVHGTVLVLIASTIGATLAFLSSRFLFRTAIHSRFGGRLKAIDRGIERDGAFYLFTLRLVPVFPFFFVNLVMGLTALPLRTFVWVSMISLLPGILVYANVGAQLARVESMNDILSGGLLASFVLLGILPLAGRWLTEAIGARIRRGPGDAR